MEDKDPYKCGINIHTGKFHTATDKMVAGVTRGDNEFSAAQKLNAYDNIRSDTMPQGGEGLFTLAYHIITGSFHALRHSITHFKMATGVSPIIYAVIACSLFLGFVHITGGPRDVIQSTGLSEDTENFKNSGFLSFVTPEIDFYGVPNKIPDNNFVPKLVEIYSGILTESEIMGMTSNSSYKDPAISQLRFAAAKKGKAQEFDQRTIAYLNGLFKQDSKYKNYSWKTRVGNPYNPYYTPRNGKPERFEVITYYLGQD